MAVESDSREAAECFSREFMPWITAGPQGTTGYAEGRPRIHPVFRYWPCLIARDEVSSQVEILTSAENAAGKLKGGDRAHSAASSKKPTPRSVQAAISSHGAAEIPTHLYHIACARSGDKGTSVNVGVIARSEKWWPLLESWLTTDRVAAFFAPLGIKKVERYELSNLRALNFLIHDALNGLRTDAQGKAFGQTLLEMPLPDDAMRRINRQ